MAQNQKANPGSTLICVTTARSWMRQFNADTEKLEVEEARPQASRNLSVGGCGLRITSCTIARLRDERARSSGSAC